MQWKKKIAVAVLFSVAVCGCNLSKNESPAVVKFNGGVLTKADIEAHEAVLKQKKQFADNPEIVTPEFVIDHAVNMEMIIQEGLDRKLHLDPRVRQEIHAHMSDLFLRILTDELVPQIDRDNITEEEMRAYYDENPESYETPAVYSIRSIRSQDRSAANAAFAAITSGSMEFEAAAATFAPAPEGGEGETGNVERVRRSIKQFRPDWRKALSRLETGKVGGPFQLGDEWVVIEVLDITPPVRHGFEEKKAYIRNDVLYARYRKAWEDTYTRLREKFDVRIMDGDMAGGPSLFHQENGRKS